MLRNLGNGGARVRGRREIGSGKRGGRFVGEGEGIRGKAGMVLDWLARLSEEGGGAQNSRFLSVHSCAFAFSH